MKCPYQTRVIHKPEFTNGCAYAEDVTEFCDCVQSECPFYYTREYKHKSTRLTTGHCRRAERSGEE